MGGVWRVGGEEGHVGVEGEWCGGGVEDDGFVEGEQEAAVTAKKSMVVLSWPTAVGEDPPRRASIIR